MRVTVVQQTLRTNPCGESVASGLRHLGHHVTQVLRGEPVNTPVVACWGWRAGQIFKGQGKRVLVMERGYVGDRFQWYSLGWNGLNGRATFPPAPDDSGRRFREHHGHLLKPWRARGTGKYVLLAAQVPGDASLRGVDLMPWYSRVAAAATRVYNLPVLFREHPRATELGYRNRSPSYTERCIGTLAEALAGAEVCLTYNSNTAVDAVLAGVPTVVDNRGSMAWSVASARVGEIVTPAREPWAHDLAWKQWRLEEIARGIPFTHLEQP